MVKYFELLHKAILLNFTYLVFISFIVQATDEDDDVSQFEIQNTPTSSENKETSSRSARFLSISLPNNPWYLSLTVPPSKMDLIIQKEIELKNSYSDKAVHPRGAGHYWDLSQLSHTEALNVCSSLWVGLKFNEIDEIDKTDLPHQLYTHCSKATKYPIRDIRSSGKRYYWFNIVYPNTEKQFKSRQDHVSVLQCFCKFIRKPSFKLQCNNSNRKFYAYKFKDDEYLILAPVSKERNKYRDLEIIDVQNVDPNTVHLGDKNYTPVLTYEVTEQSTSVCNNNETIQSGSSRTGESYKSYRPKHLKLTLPYSKINLIIQKENEMKNNYNYLTAVPRQPGHHWNLSELSPDEATNVCYSLWLGYKFSEIDDIDKTNLPPQLYSHCKAKKIPIAEINDFGTSSFSYSIVYPYTDSAFEIKPQFIGVLQCSCKYTRRPNIVYVSNDSYRKFFAHKFHDNDYLILSIANKNRHMYRNLRIIDVQEVDAASVYLGGKNSIPVFTS